MRFQLITKRFSKWMTVLIATVIWGVSAGAEVSEKYFEVYGFGMLDYIQDANRVDPAWVDTMRPSKIPTTEGTFGSDGEASLSPKQSRIGVQSSFPLNDSDFFTKVEFDFFGVGADEGQTTIRLRHAYGEWGQWLAGQTNSLFMDGDLFPNVIDYWGPTGMVFFRTPQIRWTPIKGDYIVALAIEDPGNSLDTGNIRELAPELGSNLQPHSKMPDLTAMYRQNRGWGHFQASGILRSLGYETRATANNRPKDSETGWGIDLGTKFRIMGANNVILSAVYGEGIASYMNDGGVDLAPEGQIGSLTAAAVPLLGLMAYYEHAWSEQWTSAVGYSRTSVENTNRQAGDAYKLGEYASVNALYTPVKNLMSGAEVLWGRREDNNGESGSDLRLQVSMKYSFASRAF